MMLEHARKTEKYYLYVLIKIRKNTYGLVDKTQNMLLFAILFLITRFRKHLKRRHALRPYITGGGAITHFGSEMKTKPICTPVYILRVFTRKVAETNSQYVNVNNCVNAQNIVIMTHCIQ